MSKPVAVCWQWQTNCNWMCLFLCTEGQAADAVCSLCRRSLAGLQGSAWCGQVRGEGGHGASPPAVQQEQEPQPDHTRRAQHQGEGQPRIHAGTLCFHVWMERGVSRMEDAFWRHLSVYSLFILHRLMSFPASLQRVDLTFIKLQTQTEHWNI